jgi:hypothetical protein
MRFTVQRMSKQKGCQKMTTIATTAAERLIAGFYGKNLRAFYPSSVDGTRCVEVFEFDCFRTETVMYLASDIIKYKRMMHRIRKTNAEKATIK